MARYRDRLPQLDGGPFLADGGIETTLMFLDGLALPDFAAFHLLRSPSGDTALRRYFRSYADIASRFGTGLVLESATWRASSAWGSRLGYDAEELADANREAIELIEDVRRELDADRTPVVISGCVGPRGDGYVPGAEMTEREAEAYHREQVDVFAGTNADMVSAITMTYTNEALGIARAAEDAAMPVAIAFTVETDGRLPTGQPLREAIEQVDSATSGYPAYYMINCAHPTHFRHVLDKGVWLERIRGVRANASCRSHAELNEAPDLDAGDPDELAGEYAELAALLPKLNVLGGCCGTDHRHIERIAERCVTRQAGLARQRA